MDYKIISDKEILHRAEFNEGPRVSRVQVVEIDGVRHLCEFITQGKNLIRITSRVM